MGFPMPLFTQVCGFCLAPESLKAWPPMGFLEAEELPPQLLQCTGSDGKANYRPSILSLLHTKPLKIKSMLKQLAIGEF